MSGAEKSTWEGRLGAAAEQTKEAPLGLQARDRILQHTWGWVSAPPWREGSLAVRRGPATGDGAQGSGKDQASRSTGPGPAEHGEGEACSSPGHVLVDVDFAEVLLGFRVVKAHCPHTAAQ